jgi:hypothetical protein
MLWTGQAKNWDSMLNRGRSCIRVYILTKSGFNPVFSTTVPRGSCNQSVRPTTHLHIVLKVQKDWSYTSTRRPRLTVGFSADANPSSFILAF